jgi:D-amino-acid oxidase
MDDLLHNWLDSAQEENRPLKNSTNGQTVSSLSDNTKLQHRSSREITPLSSFGHHILELFSSIPRITTRISSCKMVTKVQQIPAPTPQKHIIIIGAGVTGLTTALKLNSDPASAQHHITIIASHLPGDESIDYTSPWAGADWSPQAGGSPADADEQEYDKRTYDLWTLILENNQVEAEHLGLGFKESRVYWGKEGPETEAGDGRGLWWKDIVKGFEVLDLTKEKGVPEGAIMGVKFRTICLSVPQHLRYLIEKVRKAGIDVIKADVDVSHGLEGIVKDAKRIAMASNQEVKEDDVFALINCTGLGARHFVGENEAAKLLPLRGQTIIVKGEATMDRTYGDYPDNSSTPDESVYVIPRPGSGTTILGGCKQAGNWDPKVDENLSQRIMERIKKWGLAEELRTKDGDFEVVSSQVGLRPGRKGGPRVEVEGNAKVDGVWLVHSYGHAGAGYEYSAGCSEKVAKLVADLSVL